MNFLIYLSENMHGSWFWNMFFKTVSCIADKGLIWIVIGVSLLIFKKTRKSGFYMLICLLLVFILNEFALKYIIRKDRPFVTNPELKIFLEQINYKLPAGYSMPSGHSLCGFACATILTLFWGWKGILSYVLAGLIAFSRLFLCVHYPSDVLVGACVGILFALALFFAIATIKKQIVKNKRSRIYKLTYENKRSDI